MIKFGIIGAGNIATIFCQAVLNSDLDVKLEGIASRSLDKAKLYQEKYNISKAYDSYTKLYQDESIDVIYVATPHGCITRKC